MKSNNDLRANLDFAIKFFRNKNFVKAEKLYKKIIKKFPNNFEPLKLSMEGFEWLFQRYSTRI